MKKNNKKRKKKYESPILEEVFTEGNKKIITAGCSAHAGTWSYPPCGCHCEQGGSPY